MAESQKQLQSGEHQPQNSQHQSHQGRQSNPDSRHLVQARSPSQHLVNSAQPNRPNPMLQQQCSQFAQLMSMTLTQQQQQQPSQQTQLMNPTASQHFQTNTRNNSFHGNRSNLYNASMMPTSHQDPSAQSSQGQSSKLSSQPYQSQLPLFQSNVQQYSPRHSATTMMEKASKNQHHQRLTHNQSVTQSEMLPAHTTSTPSIQLDQPLHQKQKQRITDTSSQQTPTQPQKQTSLEAPSFAQPQQVQPLAPPPPPRQLLQKEFQTRSIRTYKEMKQKITQLQLSANSTNVEHQSLSLPPTLPSETPSKTTKYLLPQQQSLSYNQILKKECPQLGTAAQVYQQLQNQASSLPAEVLKQALQQTTSEVLKKVLARCESMTQLRQMIDLRGRKVKHKNYDGQVFVSIIEKEQQRIQQENILIAKQNIKIDDKTLIKNLQKMVKKMLKPFKGLQFDEFLHNEIHLNEIMTREDDAVDPMKESRKRHLRILDAALKEQVVDTQLTLGICVQISRQAFYNELMEYFVVAHEFITQNQKDFQGSDVQLIQGLKHRIQKMKPQLKVQIQQNKKLDKMFWLLLEQNQEVKNQIQNYKEKYEKSQEQPQPAAPVLQIQKQPQPRQLETQTNTSFNMRSSSNTGGGTSQSYNTTVSLGGGNSSRQSTLQDPSQNKGSFRFHNTTISSSANMTAQRGGSSSEPGVQQPPRRRLGSRTNNGQELLGTQTLPAKTEQQSLGGLSLLQKQPAPQQDEGTPPRQLISQRQQRGIDVMTKTSIDVNDMSQKQGKSKLLQPLVLKAPKTVALTSLKAKALQEGPLSVHQQSEVVFNQAVPITSMTQQTVIISGKKSKKGMKQRRILEPLTDTKIVDFRKTDSNFMAVSPSPMRYQANRLNPLSQDQMSQQNKTEQGQEDICECEVPQVVADKEDRKSAEFKMRIVTKRRSVLKHQTRMVCEHCGGTIHHALHGSFSQTTVKKSEGRRSINQSDFRQEVEMPNFNIEIARLQIGLSPAGGGGNNTTDDEGEDQDFGGNTERLRELGFGQGSDRLSDQEAADGTKQISVYDMLNTRYVNRISVEYLMHEFIIQNRLQKIQRFYKCRHARRVEAANLICLRSKLFLVSRTQRDMKRARLQYFKAQLAINRIAEMYTHLKVKKVHASMVLFSKELYERIQQLLCSPNATQIIKAITSLQRKCRANQQKKYRLGRQILKSHNASVRLWKDTLSKYRTSRNVESELMTNEVMFNRESHNLERYFWRQQVSYVAELDQMSEMIKFRTQRDFNQSEWSYDGEKREWSSKTGVLKFALEKQESNSQQVLKDKVIGLYCNQQMPSSIAIEQQMQGFVDSKHALQTLHEQERHNSLVKAQKSVKQQRLQRMSLA